MLENTQVIDYIVTGGVGIITLLLTLVGYFLRVFGSSVKELKNAVDQLTVIVSVEKEKIRAIKESNEIEHALHDKEIDALLDRIDKVEKDVLVIITKLDRK